MKIVLIDKEEGNQMGGLVVFNQRLSDFLSSKGHKVYILRFSRKPVKQKNVFQIPYYFAEKRSYIFVPSEKALEIIKSYLEDIKPDIIYIANGLSPLDFLLPSLFHQLKIPVVGVWHVDFNYSISSYQLLIKSIFLAYLAYCRQLDLLHVFSPKLAVFFADKGIPKKRILVLPNGVDQKLYTPGRSNFAGKFRIKKGVLFLGRLTLQKNPETLIRSFLSLDPPQDTKLVLVGHGELEKGLKEKYQDKRVIFTGLVTDERQKLDIIRSCQISVLPSRAEGMPLAILEAMSCGLACIASDAGANRELVEHAGIVIPSTRLNQELPSALRICLDNPEFVKSLGEKARKKIAAEYSQEMIFYRLAAALEKTILDYKKRGSPTTKPIDINKKIIRKLAAILRRVENFVNLDYFTS